MKAKPENSDVSVAGSGFLDDRRRRDGQHQHARRQEQQAGTRIGERRRDREQQPADGRPDDLRGLVGGRPHGGGARDHLARHQVREQRHHGRQLERPRDADDEDDAEDGVAAEPAAGRAEHQQGDGEPDRHLADGDDPAPVEMVGQRADDQRQRNDRQELGQTDQPEIERVVGHGVELPADRHAHDVEGDRGRRRAPPRTARTADAAAERTRRSRARRSCGSGKNRDSHHFRLHCARHHRSRSEMVAVPILPLRTGTPCASACRPRRQHASISLAEAMRGRGRPPCRRRAGARRSRAAP